MKQYRKNSRLEQLAAPIHYSGSEETGQTILIMAFALVALLLSSGLAVDGGMMLLRKSQLDRAVDAASLAGVTRLSEGLDHAHSEGQQVMAANGIIVTSPADCDKVNWSTNDYCGQQEPGLVPGAVRYHVEASWVSETYFMSLIGIDRIPLRSIATAEYLPLVDLYASDVSELGLLKTANQSVFGPKQQKIGAGDPYTMKTGFLAGSGTGPNPFYKELYGAYTYRVRIPGDYEADNVRVEIFDPDTGNPDRSSWDSRYYRPGSAPGKIDYHIYGVDGTSTTGSGAPIWTACAPGDNGFDEFLPNACVLQTTPWSQTEAQNPNPYWFIRVDEARNTVGYFDGSPADYKNYPAHRQYNTTTLYRLFYLRQDPDGTLHEVDLAYYLGKPDNGGIVSPTGVYDAAWAQQEAINTDLKWVSPGAGASDRMPAFDGTGRNCVFNELIGLSGSQSSEINQPDPDFCIPAEPVTKVENCDAYRQAHYGTRESGGFTMASSCGPSNDHNFVVNLKTEVPGIYVDPNNGLRDLFIQVRGLDGSSENGYEFWAGPSPDDDSDMVVPTDGNARQLYILGALSKGLTMHSSQGVGVFAMGYMPMNSNTGAPVDIPLAYFGPEFAGQKIYIQMFDPDSLASSPIVFYFDTMPQTDWSACLQDSFPGWTGGGCSALGLSPVPGQTARIGNNVGSDKWQNPPYSFSLPSEGTGQPFYGGRFYSKYRSGANDTFTWKVTIESRPYLVR
jgi:hypothetical protein